MPVPWVEWMRRVLALSSFLRSVMVGRLGRPLIFVSSWWMKWSFGLNVVDRLAMVDVLYFASVYRSVGGNCY